MSEFLRPVFNSFKSCPAENVGPSAEIIIKSYQESFFKNKKCGLASGRAGNVIGGGDWSENRLIPDTINSIIQNKTIFISFFIAAILIISRSADKLF